MTALQSFIEFIRQRTDKEVRIKCEARLRDAEKNVKRLEAKLGGPRSWRCYSDRRVLVAEYERRDGLILLCDDYRQEEKRRQEQAQPVRKPAEDLNLTPGIKWCCNTSGPLSTG